MPALVPSFIEKVGRAKKHLIDLKAAIEEFAAMKPYGIAERIEGKHKRKVRRLEFTGDPANTLIPIISADVVYNLRSSLDHLMNSIVPKKRRGHVFFPIYFQGVWESVVPGENKQRVKQRGRWLTDVKGLSEEAVTILKGLQPPDGSLDEDEVNLLVLINAMSNTDRHTKIPVFAAGLDAIAVRWQLNDGSTVTGAAKANAGRFIKNHAELGNIPDEAMNMEIGGVPRIVAPTGDGDWHVRIPEDLDLTVLLIEKRIIPSLSTFVQPAN